MKVLVVGSGGREHALCWKIASSKQVSHVFCAPGNPGTAEVGENVPINAGDTDALLAFALGNNIDLTVVGPEQPLVEGLADRFREKGLAVFGPSKAGAELEGSKAFAKAFMLHHGIPTAASHTFDSRRAALGFLASDDATFPIVVKADGLAAGKGVLICEDRGSAESAIEMVMGKRAFGEAGNRVVLEEFLSGVEASIHIITDGEAYVLLPTAKDHKKIFDGGKGPNTGGMGAVSPAPAVDDSLLFRMESEIIKPFIRGLKQDGIAFRGTVFFGLMLTEKGPFVLEFNVRFGDPESQVIFPRIESDIVPILASTAAGRLSGKLVLKDEVAVAVVGASSGYPGSYKKGLPIDISFDFPASAILFHAGTKRIDGKLMTAGGRVLAVTGLGRDVESARNFAYSAIRHVKFDGMVYRKDISKV
ncbi:MAG: phosphoribosylamine--glycine ligase [Acidobacteria bacterium]|nr:MAG: phosphoribosylamine--glycine ligase [Acidobacteriota bacterium]RLE23680.1 MAG: phosphoribosylamine--glycine ligase [Acidobacteriota bacterium]